MKRQFLIYCVKENVGYFETFKEAFVNEMNTRGKKLVFLRVVGAAMVMRQPGISLISVVSDLKCWDNDMLMYVNDLAAIYVEEHPGGCCVSNACPM